MTVKIPRPKNDVIVGFYSFHGFLRRQIRGILRYVLPQVIVMALFPLRLVKISRFFFFAIVIFQAVILAKYQADHKKNNDFYGLVVMFIIVALFSLVLSIYHEGLLYRLGLVWFCYSLALVIMIGVIFGGIVIEDNQLRGDRQCKSAQNNVSINSTVNVALFGPKALTATLSLTPVQMLLLLTSVTDKTQILTELYFTATLDMFDGVEMLEVLLHDNNDTIPKALEIAILIAVSIFFFFSFLEVHQVKFDSENENADPRPRKKTTILNTLFRAVLNFTFMVIRSVVWLKYDHDAAIFLAKNLISLAILLLQVLKLRGWIATESSEKPKEGNSNAGPCNNNPAFLVDRELANFNY